MDFKKLLSTTFKVILSLALGILLLKYIYNGTDFSQIWFILQNGVDYNILLFSLVFGLIANIIRAYRWGLLIDSLGEKYKMSNLVYTVLGNYAINFVLPRAGEVWRCGVITKYEKISFTKLIGTLLVDRVFDTIAVGLITIGLLIFNFGFFKQYFTENINLVEGFSLLNTTWLILILFIIGGIIWYIFTYMNSNVIVQKLKGVFKNIWEGMQSVWLMENKIQFLIQTIAIWVGYFFYFYLTFFAFDFTKDLGFVAGLVTFVMSSIGVAAPTQGGLGAWHFMTYTTLMIYGVSMSDALAFAMVVFAVQSLWMIVSGLFGIVALPLTNPEQTKSEPLVNE
ncbi:MAG: flippase-like domain-containing protein [Tannerellaceae bacterium]|nr:flippase-like domain-containing protein [Tannerellaceae bacterium]